MNNFKSFGLLGLLFAVALVLASCAGSDAGQQQQEENNSSESAQEESQGGEMTGMDMGSGETAPAMLVRPDGEYTDGRFIDMIAAHHQMAIEMAQAEQEYGEISELRQIAENIISSQQQEIEELRSIKEGRFDSSDLPTMMNPEDQMMSTMVMPDELGQQESVDRAFIDSMLPHHSGAIQLASTARMRSEDPEIQRIARNIIDEQSREIGEMIALRQQYYPESA